MFKLQSQLLLLIITSTNLHCAFGNTNTALKADIVASQLFDIAYNSIDDTSLGANYNYNNWKDSANMHKQGKCDAYDGGHSGIDIQTKDVAGYKTTDRTFYSLTKGKVMNAGGDKYNTIAIFDQQQNITSIYLHARKVEVSLYQNVIVGQKLGIQGDSGIRGKEHVHFEARKGKYTNYACGASDPTSLDPIKIALTYINSQSASFIGNNLATNATFFITTSDGQQLKTRDFTNTTDVIVDPVNVGNYILHGGFGYCRVRNGGCPMTDGHTDFQIEYRKSNNYFSILLVEEPLSTARQHAEEFLVKKLGIKKADLCRLNYSLVVPYWVTEKNAGEELGFSNCLNSIAL